jgi:hypothetical protein
VVRGWLGGATGYAPEPLVQAVLINTSPRTFFRPPYVGVRGWVGVELDSIGDEELSYLIREAWQLVAPKGLKKGR